MSDTKVLEALAADVGHLETSAVSEDVAKHAQHCDEETKRWTAESPIVIDAVTNKRLFWKINRRVLVVMLVTYFCQSLDKGTLNFSSIMGIQKDANLHGQQVIKYPGHP